MLEPGVQGVEFVELNRNVRDCENKRPRWWYYPSFIGGKQWQIESESLCLRWEDHPLLSSLDGYTGCTPRNMPIQNLPPENPYSTLFQLQHSLPQNCVWFSLIWRGSNHGRPEIITHGIMVQVEKLNDDLRVVRSMIQIIIICYLLFSFLWSTFWICQNLRHFWLADQAGFARLVGSGGCKQRAVPQTQISEIFDVHVSLVPLLRFIPSLWILPAQYGDIFPIPLTYGGAISERSCRFFFPFRWWIERGRSHCTGKTSSSKSIGFIDGSCKVTLRLGICQTCGENVKQPEGVHLAPAGGFLFDKMWKKRDWMISLWSI